MSLKRVKLHSWIPSLVALLLVLGFLVLPTILGRVLRQGVSPLSLQCAAAERVWKYKLWSAHDLQNDGRLDEAEKEYRAALESPSRCIQDAADAGLNRIAALKEQLGPSYRVIAETANLSTILRAPIVSALFLLGVCLLGMRMFPRRGARIADFPVYGTDNSRAGVLFRDGLIWFANEIKRVYGSEYAQKAGMILLLDDLKGEALEDKSLYEQAIADAQDPGAKAAVRFALTQIIRFLRDSPRRPVVSVEGHVNLFPGSAKVIGIVKDLRAGEETRVEADTSELEELPIPQFVQARLLNPPFASPAPTHFRKAEEMRLMSAQLFALSLVFACKIRLVQSRTAAKGYKPHSWKTICLFAAAAWSLE
jgi:hypothetical protein